MVTMIIGVLGFIVLLGVSILVHEFGHFVSAKIFGVGVEEFALGMGPRVCGKKWGETEYVLNWIPFGGYVKMQGMLLDELEEATDEKPEQQAEDAAGEADKSTMVEKATGDNPLADMAALRNKPWLVKVIIFSAGCFFNYLLAFVIFSLLLFYGIEHSKAFDSFLGSVPADTTMAESGFLPGDRIVRVEGHAVETWEDIGKQLTSATFMLKAGRLEDVLAVIDKKSKEQPGFNVALTIRRKNGQQLELALPPAPDWLADESFNRYFQPPLKSYIDGVTPHGPADKAGLKDGDIITAIAGQPVEYAVEASNIISAAKGEPLELEYLRDGEKHTCQVTPKPATEPSMNNRLLIGIGFGNQEKEIEQYALIPAFVQGFHRTNHFAWWVPVKTVEVFGSGFKNIKANLGGPVMIANLAYRQAEKGWQDYFSFFAIINIILMVMNLLPIPILDGGHIVIATIESAIRRPIPEKVLIPVFNVFFFLLIALFVLITFNDMATIFIK